MIAGNEEPRAGRERRIIERPRLIKLLDESEARIILLLAPAGYGKTTLARQWAKTLNGAIWVSLTPAHRDVVTFAEDVAAGIERLGGDSTEFIRKYLRAQNNPQTAAHGVAVELSKQMNDVGVQWLIVDDCQEIAGAPEACTMISTLTERLDCRMLMSSRDRPSWTRSRHVVYGKVSEVDRAELAMTKDEVAQVVGPRPDIAELALQAAGWPAVLSLVAALDSAAPLRSAMPVALHRYLAEELFQSAPETLRASLLTLALLPSLSSESLVSEFGERRGEIINRAHHLGFIKVAMREGQLELAIDLAGRARERLGGGHPLRSRSNAIAGHGHFLLASYDEAEAAFTTARVDATDGRDAAEAIHGLVQTRIFGERGQVKPVLEALSDLKHESPTHLMRYATAELNRRRFDEGLNLPLGLDEALHTLPRVDDPRARTSFTYSAAYAFALRADYDGAENFLNLFLEDIRSFDLEFALPYANWTAAMIALGLRRFGEAERSLQAVEDAAKRAHEQRHAVNAQSLRARMLLQTGQLNEALRCVQRDVTFRLIPSWLGEYVGTRALVLACLDKPTEANTSVERALEASRAAEVRILAASARAICEVKSHDPSAALRLADHATALGVWDPVICAIRSSAALADAFAEEETLRSTVESLYQQTRDHALARRAGFRTRSSQAPDELLSPREREVLGLIARGLRNHEISTALFIADSTTKVHVGHILEKLGVRTRAEAVARYEMFATGKRAEPDSDPNST